MTEAPTLVVLGGGPAQRHAIDAAHALGVRTLVCDSDPGVGDLLVSSEDPDGVRAAAEGAAGLIAPGTDWPVRVAAAAARDLGLPHPIGPDVAVVATDKIAQRRALDAAGVPQPAWSTDEPPAYPCVVKAPDRQGQRAMSILADPADLAGGGAAGGGGVAQRARPLRGVRPGPGGDGERLHRRGPGVVAAVNDRVHFREAPGVAQRHVYPPERDPSGAAATPSGRSRRSGSTPARGTSR